MIELPTRDRFAASLNGVFQIERGEDSISVELTEVSEMGSSRHHEAFSLVFRGPRDAFLPQSVYRLDHSALGPVDLLLVPIGQDKQGLYYESVISRVREEDQQ